MNDPAMAGSGHERLDRDAYDTLDADWIVPCLLRFVALRDIVWEPAAGRGCMSDELERAGYHVIKTDIAPRRHDIEESDFLMNTALFDGTIITNPPYDGIDEFVEHALLLTAKGGQVCILARSEWAQAAKRRNLIHANPLFVGEIALTKRPRWFADGDSSPRHYFSWFVWDWLNRDQAWLKFAP